MTIVDASSIPVTLKLRLTERINIDDKLHLFSLVILISIEAKNKQIPLSGDTPESIFLGSDGFCASYQSRERQYEPADSFVNRVPGT